MRTESQFKLAAFSKNTCIDQDYVGSNMAAIPAAMAAKSCIMKQSLREKT